ncbi:MAG: thiol reductant ABC exporter subunit CydD [Anaerolineales bacterium]
MHRRLLALARTARLALSLTILTGLLTGWLAIAQAHGLSLLVDAVFLGGADVQAAAGLLGFLLAVIGLRALLAWAGESAAGALAVRVKHELRARLFDKLLALGPAYTRGERSGELTAAAVEGVEALDAYFGQYLPQLAVTALVPLSILFFVFPLDWISGLVLLLTAPLIPLFMILIGRTGEALTRRQYTLLGRLSASFLDSLQGLVTLKQFGRERDRIHELASASDRYRQVTLSVLRVTFLSALALELLATLSTAVVAVEVGLRLLYGWLEFRQAFFVLLLAPEFYLPLRMLGLRFHAGMAGTTAARRIFEILDTPATSGESQTPAIPFGWPATLPTEWSLRLESVSLTYPGGAAPALHNINLQIHAGQHLALVGPSGAGKSTLAALLLRFLEPGEGQMILQTGGRSLPLTAIPPQVWRAQVAWVPQTPYLFHDTLANNLRLARPEASREEMNAALRAAHLDEFVRSLPQGLETVIGEEGARLSGGQAQRLALARAFLKDAPFLIMDEPTSSLDPESEALLEDSVRRLVRGRTVLTIAHRLNTVAGADRIFVLAEGRLVESGSHAELAKAGGVYARLIGRGEAVPQAQPGQASVSPPRLAEAGPDVPSGSAAWDFVPPRRPLVLRLLHFLNGSWQWVALSVLLGALTVGANVGLMGASTWLIASAALHPSIADLQVAIVGVRFFGLARGVLRYLERLVSHDVTFRLLARLRTWFYAHLEPLAPARLMQYRSGDLLNRIVADVDVLENFYVRSVGPPLSALLVAVATAFFLGQYDRLLGWVYAGLALLLGFGLPLALQLLSRPAAARLTERRAALRVLLLDGVQGLADLLAFGRGRDFAARLAAEGEAVGQAQRRLANLTGLAGAANVVLPGLALWLTLALSIPLVTAGLLPGVMLPVLALVALASFEALTPLPLAAQTLAASLESSRRLFEIVDTEAAPPAAPDCKPAALTAAPAWRVSHLTFAYPGSEQPVLQDISFELPPGKRLAVVGPSGAGKSTLAALLQRFWDPPRGSIFLDGCDLLDMTPAQARRAMAVVAQRTYLFHASLAENLLLARPAASMQELEAVTAQARLRDFVASLPDGYQTLIGERGMRLSAGERQRLALARALLRNSPLFLLDEPTANLDPLTEADILAMLLAQGRGRSLLLITHRLVGLEAMDEILVLNHGRVVERGSHADLLRRGGLYRHLYAIQRRFLREL